MKKILSLLMAVTILIILTACVTEVITLTLADESITITEGDTYTVNAVTDDEAGLTYSVSAAGIITVSNEGLVTAVSEGEVTVTISSITDADKFVTLTVIVRKKITITKSM